MGIVFTDGSKPLTPAELRKKRLVTFATVVGLLGLYGGAAFIVLSHLRTGTIEEMPIWQATTVVAASTHAVINITHNFIARSERAKRLHDAPW